MVSGSSEFMHIIEILSVVEADKCRGGLYLWLLKPFPFQGTRLLSTGAGLGMRANPACQEFDCMSISPNCAYYGSLNHHLYYLSNI